MIPIRQVFKELMVERTRLLLTVLAIAWGTAAITIMLALGEGLRLTFGRSMKGMGEGILVVWPGQTSRAYAGQPEGRRVPLTPEDLSLARSAIVQIGAISGEYRRWPQMRNGARWRSGRLSGVDPEFGPMRNIIPEPGGRFIDELDMRQRRRVIVISPQVVKELYEKGTDPVGSYLSVGGRPFRVVGVMAPKYQTSAYSGQDRDGTWIPSSTFRSVYGSRHYSNLIVKPQVPKEMAALKRRLREVIAQRHGCDPGDEEIVNDWDTLEMQQTLSNIFNGFQALLGIIGGLTLVVAGAGIANVMFISVTNATRDIGVRMAVGARGYQILAQYVVEGLAAMAIGGVIGLGISQGVISLVGQIPMEAEFFQYVGKPVPVLSTRVAGLVIAVLGLVGFAAGIFPARRAANVDPAEALRYE